MINNYFNQIILKTSIACFCNLCSVSSYSQVINPVRSKSTFPPAIYIDAQRADFPITYLDPENVESVRVVKGEDSINKKSGIIYITTKNHLPPLTLADISRGQPGLKEKNVLYIIDDKMITDTINVRIDSSIIVRIEAVHSADIPYLVKGGEPFGVLLISTKINFKKPEKDQIRLQ